MHTFKSLFVALFLSIAFLSVSAQDPTASRITHPSASLTDYHVFLFKKHLNLKQVSHNFAVYNSADPLYRLIGKPAIFGHIRSTTNNWRYENVEINDYPVTL